MKIYTKELGPHPQPFPPLPTFFFSKFLSVLFSLSVSFVILCLNLELRYMNMTSVVVI